MKNGINFVDQMWLGDPEGLHQLIAIENKIAELSVVDAEKLAMSSNPSLFAEDESLEFGASQYMVSRTDNLAIVNISGPLTTRDRSYNRYMGVVSYNEIRNAVFASMEAEGIEGIVLNMDTPGGSASGISELGEFLSEVDSSIMPICDGDMKEDDRQNIAHGNLERLLAEVDVR